MDGNSNSYNKSDDIVADFNTTANDAFCSNNKLEFNDSITNQLILAQLIRMGLNGPIQLMRLKGENR